MSFGLSASLAVLAVTYGYSETILPENTLTAFDYYAVANLREQFKLHFLKEEPSQVRPENVADDDGLVQKRRKENLGRFILALSDQQLITGLSILFAGYCKMNSMSIYHFNIVASLAWFSSATHLATLGMLRNYLIKSSAFRNGRVALIIIVCILLLIALPPRWLASSDLLPVCCFYSNRAVAGNDFLNSLMLSMFLGFVVVTYTQKLARLYSLDTDCNIADLIVEKIVKILSGGAYHEPSHRQVVRNMESSRASHVTLSTEMRLTREKTRFRRFQTTIRSCRSRFKSYVKAIGFLAEEMRPNHSQYLPARVRHCPYHFPEK